MKRTLVLLMAVSSLAMPSAQAEDGQYIVTSRYCDGGGCQSDLEPRSAGDLDSDGYEDVFVVEYVDPAKDDLVARSGKDGSILWRQRVWYSGFGDMRYYERFNDIVWGRVAQPSGPHRVLVVDVTEDARYLHSEVPLLGPARAGVSNVDHTVSSLNPANGQAAWTFELNATYTFGLGPSLLRQVLSLPDTNGDGFGEVLVARDLNLWATQLTEVFLLDGKTGKQISRSSILGQGDLFVLDGIDDGEPGLLAVEPRIARGWSLNGSRLLWEFESDDWIDVLDVAPLQPDLSDDVILRLGQRVSALDGATGELIWMLGQAWPELFEGEDGAMDINLRSGGTVRSMYAFDGATLETLWDVELIGENLEDGSRVRYYETDLTELDGDPQPETVIEREEEDAEGDLIDRSWFILEPEKNALHPFDPGVAAQARARTWIDVDGDTVDEVAFMLTSGGSTSLSLVDPRDSSHVVSLSGIAGQAWAPIHLHAPGAPRILFYSCILQGETCVYETSVYDADGTLAWRI